MKSLFLSIFLLYLCIQIGNSQIFITTNTLVTQDYNENTKQYETIVNESNYYTTMELNKEMSIMKHINDEITSIYFISNLKQVDEDMFEMQITSDVGNEYLMITNFKLLKVFVSNYTKDNIFRIRTYGIKSVFTKDKGK